MPFVPDNAPSAGLGSFMPDAPAKPTVYDAKLFEQRVGRAPEPAELQNFIANKGAGWAGDPNQGGMPLSQVAEEAIPATAEVGASGVSGLALAIPAAARYAYNLATGEGHEKAKELAGRTLAAGYQPRTDLAKNVLGTVGEVSQAPLQTYAAAAQNIAQGLHAVGVPTDPEATGKLAQQEAEGAALLSPLVPAAEGAVAASRAVARNPALLNPLHALNEGTRVLASGMQDPEAAAATSVNPKVAQATRVGVKLTPEQANSGVVGRAVQSLSGSAKLERSLSKENALAANDVGASEMGLSTEGRKPGQVITATDIKEAKAPHLETYDGAASAGEVPLEKSDFSGVSTRGTLKNAQVEELKAHYSNMNSIDSKDLLTDMAQLRADASKNIRAPFSPAQNQLGFAQRQMADALEKALGRRLENMDNPPVSLADFQNARKSLAKIHSVEDSLDEAGNVSARALNRQLEHNVPLSGGLRDLAETYGNFPRALQDVSRIRDSGPFSVLDPALAAITGSPAALAGHVVGGPVAGAAAMLARPLARAALASDRYQRAVIQNARAPAAGAQSPAFQAMMRAASAAKAKLGEEAALGATLKRTAHAAHQAQVAKESDNVVSFEQMLEAAKRRAAQAAISSAAAESAAR